MPPKKQKDKNSTGADKNFEALRTAVIVAELNADRFMPLSHWMPTCLLSLGNTPLLHISLNRLLLNGFQKIVIFACTHKDSIERFVEESGYRTRFPFVDIRVFDGYGCKSLGEVMRDIDNNSLLHEVENFVCIPADLVTDISLMEQLNNFSELRKQNPNIAIGMVFASRPDFLPQEYEYTQVTYNAETNVLVNFRRALAPTKMISTIGNSSLKYRRDLFDSRILLCSKHIPVQFQGNFDFLTIDDLVNEFLLNEDVMSYQTHIQVLPARTIVLPVAPCLKHLLLFNFSFLNRMGSRQIHPPCFFVCESTIRNESVERGQPYALSPQIFAYKSCNIHSSVKLLGHVFIGRNVIIRSGCVLIDVVIDDNCTIDKNTLIQSTVIMGGVHISSNVKITSSWLFTGACIHDGVELGPDCFVGPPLQCETPKCPHKNRLCIERVDGEEFPEGSVIIQSSEEDAEHPWMVCQPQDNSDSVSIKSFDSSDEEGFENSEKKNIFLLKSGNLWRTNWLKKMTRSRSSSSESISLSSNRREKITVPENDDDDNIINELANTLKDGVEKKKLPKDICTEITCLKHATGITIDDLIFLLTKAIFKLGSESENGEVLTALKVWKNVEQCVVRYTPIVRNFIERSASGEALCLQAAEENCCLDRRFMEMSPRLFHHLYEQDIVSEEAINSWVKNSKMLEDPESIREAEKLRERLKAFLDWLNTAESESEDEEQDSEEGGNHSDNEINVKDGHNKDCDC
ncbi:unnamed protein product [Hymenolepis diminuta]|uniref:Translation initiation factor eIF2B subunit epsilon n=1 Tax=Hymenolepis diminuta TaxID=6216 RepID=A0A0R3SS02_HYMDI|nr:unnamed protein product [Hymenolepis diminuta]